MSFVFAQSITRRVLLEFLFQISLLPSLLCRVNDWLLKINNVDLTNKDRKQVIKAVLSGEGVINMVVRRRKSLGGRVITPIQINLAGHKGQPHHLFTINSPQDVPGHK